MATKSTSESDNFVKRLQEECEAYAQQYNFNKNDRGRGFESWLAHLFAQESGFDDILEDQDPSDADLGDAIIRSNDLGVDIVLEDPDGKQLLLVQAKWTGRNKSVDHNDLESFFSIHDRLMDRSFVRTGSQHAQELLDSYPDKIRDGYSVRLRFATNRSAAANNRRQKLIDGYNEKYKENNFKVICEFYAQDKLKELEHQIESTESGILDSIQFSVKNNEAVEFNEPRHSLICRISGNELTNMYGQHKQSLFTINIRMPMGIERAINREIKETASNDSESFFFYNNGVSAVCSSFNYDAKKNNVVAKRFQIINGAQTVGAIAHADGTDELAVLFRLTETSEKTGGDFTDNIIRCNNTQNAVEVADFRSNDPIQNFLKRELVHLSGKGAIPNFYYQPKRGDKQKGRGGKRLTSKDLAALRYAILYGPVDTYRDAKFLFDATDKGWYWRAFGTNGVPVDKWRPSELNEVGLALALDNAVKDLHAKSKKQDNPPEITRYLYRSSRYIVALIFEALRTRFDNDSEWTVELFMDKKKFQDTQRALLQVAMRLVGSEIKRRRNEKGEIRPEYNFLRDQTAWETLRDMMIDEIKVSDLLDSSS